MESMLVLAGEALLPSRIQMAFTLASHVLLVPLGVALPTLTLLMEGIGIWRKDQIALTHPVTVKAAPNNAPLVKLDGAAEATSGGL